MDDAQKLIVKRAFVQWQATASANAVADRVLSSTDLIPCLMSSLTAIDWAAAATCQVWLHGWKVRFERSLRPLGYVEPDFGRTGHMSMVALPDGSIFVAINFMYHTEIRIVDETMRTLQHYEKVGDGPLDDAIADVNSLYLAWQGPEGQGAVWRIGLSELTTSLTHFANQDRGFWLSWFTWYADGESYQCLAYSPNVLFVVVYSVWDTFVADYEDIRALDPHTLTEMFRFGQDLSSVTDLKASTQELYIATTLIGSLFIYSFDGERLREIHGEWQVPRLLRIISDCLYLVEAAGKRIIVLTAQGEICYKYTWLPHNLDLISSMWAVNGRMIVHGRPNTLSAEAQALENGLHMTMIALKLP
mmetsp:Transcript_56168/g.92913  ORF Transcript_56168/g.92913 Transcript_56168/m.92913 type:complete len:360 (-) Transcript_56168:329-1408(-)